jgi:hypothetical protein
MQGNDRGERRVAQQRRSPSSHTAMPAPRVSGDLRWARRAPMLPAAIEMIWVTLDSAGPDHRG